MSDLSYLQPELEMKTQEPSNHSFDYKSQVKIKNLGSDNFMSIDNFYVKPSTKSDNVFYVSDRYYPGKFFICNEKCHCFITYRGGDSELKWSKGGYATDNKSHWIPEETPNGWLINSCHKKLEKLVLIQKNDSYGCVPWNSIKDDPEQVKFAYWEIKN